MSEALDLLRYALREFDYAAECLLERADKRVRPDTAYDRIERGAYDRIERGRAALVTAVAQLAKEDAA